MGFRLTSLEGAHLGFHVFAQGRGKSVLPAALCQGSGSQSVVHGPEQ